MLVITFILQLISFVLMSCIRQPETFLGKVFVDVFLQDGKLVLNKIVDWSERWLNSSFEVNFTAVRGCWGSISEFFFLSTSLYPLYQTESWLGAQVDLYVGVAQITNVNIVFKTCLYSFHECSSTDEYESLRLMFYSYINIFVVTHLSLLVSPKL